MGSNLQHLGAQLDQLTLSRKHRRKNSKMENINLSFEQSFMSSNDEKILDNNKNNNNNNNNNESDMLDVNTPIRRTSSAFSMGGDGFQFSPPSNNNQFNQHQHQHQQQQQQQGFSFSIGGGDSNNTE